MTIKTPFEGVQMKSSCNMISW